MSAQSNVQQPEMSSVALNIEQPESPNAGGTKWSRARGRLESVFGGRIETRRDENSWGGFSCRCIILHDVRFSFWIMLILFFLIVSALAIVDISTEKVTVDGVKENKHYVAIVIAAVFCLCSTLITIFQVQMHLKHYTHPVVQRKIIRIILMVPIYGWSAWIGLVFVGFAPYIDFIRVCYEAYVIFNFFLLLIRYMDGHEGVERIMARKDPDTASWPNPMCCLPRVKLDGKLIHHLRRGTLQYVLVTPIVAFAASVGGVTGHYEDGIIEVHNLYPWCALAINCTQLVALYCLVWLYMLTKEELAVFNPLSKFLVVKSVVFFTFWQGVFLAVLVKLEVIHGTTNFTTGEVQLGLQDFIICIEMFLAAAVHRFTFGHEAFADNSFEKQLQVVRAFHAPVPGTPAAAREDKVIHNDENCELEEEIRADDPDLGPQDKP